MAYYKKRTGVKRTMRPRRKLQTKGYGTANWKATAAKFATAAVAAAARQAGANLANRVIPGQQNRGRTKSQPKTKAESLLQFTTENKTYGRKMPTYMKTKRLVSAAREQYIFSWKAHKNFDDNGYLWAAQSIDNTQRLFPIYALLLNGRETGVAPSVAPMRRLAAFRTAGVDDGRLLWNDVNGIDPSTGVAGTQYLYTEYRPTSTHPGTSMFYDWSEVKLNLWGAKNKAVKWSIALCKVTEDYDSPWASTSGAMISLEAQQAWEETVRQYTYNPIMKLNYEKRKNRIKFLKTWEKVLQPNTSIDGDVDPQAHVLKLFFRENRNVIFDDITSTQTTGERTTDDADFAGAKEATQYIQEPYSNYPRVNQQLFLLIRASAYSTAADSGASVTNADYGSFDVSMRTKFTRLD